MYAYNDFDEETKDYLKKAMDIYSTVKDSDIQKRISINYKQRDYQFKQIDKKYISLFAAAFLTEGNIKNIIKEYDDFKLQDVLSFIDLDESRIHKLNENEYEKFYDKYFKLNLNSILQSGYEKKVKVTPETIVYKLSMAADSKILIAYAQKYDIHYPSTFMTHPLFQDLRFAEIENKNMVEKENSDIYMSDNSKNSKGLENPQIHIDLSDENLWQMLDKIKEKFVCQEDAVESLFYNIVNNQELSNMPEIADGQRSIIFLDGPSGTGKTAIVREITSKLDIPFSSSSITNYSATGYVGGNITDTLKELYQKSNGDITKAERGIIVFDEFDKIAYSKQGGLEMKRAVQQQLLDFMGGGKYTVTVGTGIFDARRIEFDTSKLTFICLGALTNLRTEKTKVSNPIGFKNQTEKPLTIYEITPEDLINLGLERELVGRLNTYIHTNNYSEEDLLKILKESATSPLIGLKKLVEASGKKLKIDEDVYQIIATEAYKLNTGARSLQTVVNNLRTHFLKEILRGKSDTIHLDKDTVKETTKSTMTRRGRL